ncbi:hypothetical protein IRP63_13880 (plasmid) [Clostridium botulinum]|uniref:Uncharacterized protein n=1 Tax=Clostridium botulinum C/D str. DC5 TaxID=1443128 RepID=A0A0A0HYS6_CLOBO|nr:hypothetical protein [Clostridium botulinum]KGM93588.1 hypothetical protein Z955_14675 [Clostridium botulinum C/D str. DC5]KOC56911.1 hypothetical protein ADU89_01585 [Clostridium botulinum]KOC57386.1 hypothetical protein ADU90_06125 [Clostridium botulinum]MCD3232622.1 hypothetical protein [Clostridium botulinum D/C]MCD3238449.1 hypothetical protein [Clostridium botulinum D/C]
MLNRKIALKIQEKVNKEGLLMVSEHKDYIFKCTLVTWYYGNNTERDKHVILMTNKGYSLEYQKHERLYGNLHNLNDNIYVPIAVYKKNLE